MKVMIGNDNDNYAPIPPLKNSADVSSPSTTQIADMFLDLFGSSTDFPKDNDTLDPIIKSYILNRSQNHQNIAFTPSELDKAFTKLKSNATGVEDIYNAILTNLSPDNKKYLLQLFNHLSINDCVPELWKRVIVIPLLKPGKPADKAASYRPISLTSCLGKLFERILTNRLN